MKSLIEFVIEDDRQILMEKQLKEAKRQNELLKEAVELLSQTNLSNHQQTVVVDMSVPHDDTEVWHTDGSFKPTTLTAHATDVEYWYALKPGQRVRVPAGMILEITEYDMERLFISNTETVPGATLEITLTGKLVA